MTERKALEELRAALWEALGEEHRDLAEETLRHFDMHAGFLAAAIIDAGGELVVSQKAWEVYATNSGNLRTHRVNLGSSYRLRITDRNDNPLVIK